MGGHSRPLRCGSERKKQNASYVLMVFQQRNGADSFGTSQFDGRKEMVWPNRIAPEHTLSTEGSGQLSTETSPEEEEASAGIGKIMALAQLLHFKSIVRYCRSYL
ncbi:jg19125 [Pararge aegeria aegeria]|uniref:Jg19125 protein n=1 Tax=Pararge aegeria aegeria TaxID=348720 RepID=A0A8S4QWQ0_9NEOP|nr:jg19125 [Pararge aegeria aegeria]